MEELFDKLTTIRVDDWTAVLIRRVHRRYVCGLPLVLPLPLFALSYKEFVQHHCESRRETRVPSRERRVVL